MKNKLFFNNNKRIRILLLTMLIGFLNLTSCDNSTAQQKKNNSGKVTDTKSTSSNQLFAPDFSLADLEGNTITLEQMRGKVVLLNFWGNNNPHT